MYHCHIHFYLTGHHNKLFEIIKEMPPLEYFTHEFSASDEPEKLLLSQADVIFADLHNANVKETLKTLTSFMKKEAELILIAESEQISLLSEFLPKIKDIWNTPVSDEEIKFRFLRWQQTCKMSKDFWQSENYLNAALNNSPNLIWYKDKNGIHRKVNDSFCKTVNKTKSQVEGRGHAYIWDVEQDDPVCIESENEVMSTGKTLVAEEIIKTGEGMRTLTTYKSPLYDIDGSVMGTVGVAIDVTQEHAYEKELLNKSQVLETLFTTMDCGVLSHTADGTKIISINKAALKILGYESQDEMLRAGFNMIADSVMDEDKSALMDSIKSLKKNGDSVSVEYRVCHNNGDILYVMGNIKLVEENGELFYQRYLLDYTDRKLKEKKNERRHKELIQALSIDYNLVCFFELNTGMGDLIRVDDNSSMFNSVFNENISFEESMERYIREFVYEEDRDMLRKAFSAENIKKELTENKTYHVNYRTDKDGSIEYFQIKAVRTETDDDHYGMAVGFRSVDKEIRSEMEKQNLLEDALMQANRANKAKTVFLSNMSHDIRTPMNAIVGFTTLAISHIDQKEQVEEYLKKIMTSGNHLLSLINDVLDMSRIESGKMHLDEKPCNLPDILHGLQHILQANVHAKQIELYMDTVDVIHEEIYCDKLRLNQVLLNLLSNSVKFTSAGGTVSMRITEKKDAPAGYAIYEFYIKDTGIGMSEEFISHIFEPFERERNSTISGIQGTGLGMAITKNIVDMMNGTIEVKSKQGVGSEFILSFMFRLNDETKKSKELIELKDCRALVVDDDFNSCDSVSYMLNQIGLRAEWTLSGKEAVLRSKQASMRNDNYLVYVIDWMLPDMDGIEVARRIRKDLGNDVPIIIMTAYDWTDIEDEARNTGITAFCSKPLFLSELRDCLNSIINTNEIHKHQDNDNPKKIRTGRILLAEDNELNQEIASAILDEAGFKVDIAGNGQVAVDMLKQSEPGYYQVVLMDVQMPVMDGYEATKRIRKLENKELASIPILAMTANAFEEDRQEALKCGMNDHVTKPIDVNNLFSTLDKVLR